MTHPPQRPRSAGPARLTLRLALYLLISWGSLGIIASGLFPGSLALLCAIAIYTTLPIAAFIRWRGWPFYPGAKFRLLVVRPFWYANLMLPFLAGAALLGMLLGAPFGRAISGGRIAAGSVLAILLVMLAVGYLSALRLVVRRVDADVSGLPEEFDGLTIAQLSDLHLGPHTSRRFLRRVVETVRGLAPDVIAVTGDLIDDRHEDVASYVAALGALAAPLGVFMIPGNHDVYAGWDDVERGLHAANLGTVLVNDAHFLVRGDARLALVGTGDPAAGARGSSRSAPDIERALRHVPADTTVIAFAHNPSLWPSLAARGVALTLSGHTHWGQLALPRLGWSLATPFIKHAMGAHVVDDAVLYVSPGTGYWGVPFRLGVNPEVTLVTLRRGAVGAVRVHPARVA